MVKAGEESGGLPANLKEVAGHLEKAYNLTKKIKGALTYPLIILSAIGLVGVLMMIFVVPTLIKTFEEVGADLPASTKLIIGLSNFLSHHTILFVLCVLAFGVGLYFIFKIKKVSEVFDSVILKLPVIGVIAKEMNSARTTRTLGSLLSSGVDISRAITITRDVVQSHPYKLLLEEARLKVEKGAPLSGIIKSNTNLYPVMVGEMMEVGEETGKLTDMLHDIATFYEDEVDAKTKDLSTVIEPMLMIFIGAAVGFFAISMISPMYSLVDNIK
jgi:type IV pilus assembly protein PilC